MTYRPIKWGPAQVFLTGTLAFLVFVVFLLSRDPKGPDGDDITVTVTAENGEKVTTTIAGKKLWQLKVIQKKISIRTDAGWYYIDTAAPERIAFNYKKKPIDEKSVAHVESNIHVMKGVITEVTHLRKGIHIVTTKGDERDIVTRAEWPVLVLH